MILKFSEQVTEVMKEISQKRDEIKEEFTKAYLAAIIPEGVPFEDFIQKIELVEQWSRDRMSVNWYFRERKDGT